jgi:hypothetical protein
MQDLNKTQQDQQIHCGIVWLFCIIISDRIPSLIIDLELILIGLRELKSFLRLESKLNYFFAK